MTLFCIFIFILLGQAYVALSRATTLEGLQVLNFDATKVCFLTVLKTASQYPIQVQAHPKVVAWSKTLSTITDS